MRLAAIIIAGLLTLIFAAGGALMLFSPVRHAAFWRWYSARFGNQVPWVESGDHVQLRIAGLIILVVSIFFGWILARKILAH
jgi:hypothetical protein